MIEQEQFCSPPRTELCETQNWIRQTMRDVWESKNWEGLCCIPWQMLGPELKLTKKVTVDKEGAAPPLPFCS